MKKLIYTVICSAAAFSLAYTSAFALPVFAEEQTADIVVTEEKITDIETIRAMLTEFVKENNLDARIVSNEEYPGYQPIVVEFNRDAEINAWAAVLDYIAEKNIEMKHINVVPIVDGIPVTTANPNVGTTTTTTTTEEIKTYSFDELMEMSLEELETEAGFVGISESMERIAAQPPMEIQACRLEYYILLKDYENVIPTLYETITGVNQDGNPYTLDVVSRGKTAALLGLPEKLISASVCTIGLNDFGSEVIRPLGLSEAEILVVHIMLRAYGDDNINKTYCLITRLLEFGHNENILNIKRAGWLGGYEMPGDATCDNSVDVCDAVLIAKFLAEDSEAFMTEQGKRNADFNKDGDITQDDVVLILQKIARLI